MVLRPLLYYIVKLKIFPVLTFYWSLHLNSSLVSQWSIDSNWFFELHTLQCQATPIEYVHAMGDSWVAPGPSMGHLKISDFLLSKNAPLYNSLLSYNLITLIGRGYIPYYPLQNVIQTLPLSHTGFCQKLKMWIFTESINV